MRIAILCLYLAGSVSAAPFSPFFNYLPHFGSPKQSGRSTQGNDVFYPPMPSHPQPVINAPYSMEIVFPARFPGHPSGGQPSGPAYPSQGFIKYSLPKAPGRKSVEIYYPYDFMQRQVNVPQMPQQPNIFPFEYPPQTVPQQPPQMPPYQDPVQAAQQQEQHAQAGQVLPGQP